MPEIDSSYYITKAIFNVKTKTAPTTKASVYLKEVLGDWNSQTITYNNAPALNDKTLDYQYMEANSTWYAYKDCLTVVTDNLSGKKLFYHFNDYGNCISVNDQLGYACFAKYTDSNPINHPETISKMQRSVVNFLNGHNMQTAGIWTNESLDGTGTYSYATDAHYMGTKSLKMVKTNQTGWMTTRQDVTLPKGKAYTLSAFFQTLADTVAQLRVTYKNSDGNEVAVDSLPQCSKGEWGRMSVSFSLPADSTSDSATVRLMAGGGAGTVWFDCAQLEAGEVANRYNMLTNGDFTFNCGAHPTGWSKNTKHGIGIVDIVENRVVGMKSRGVYETPGGTILMEAHQQLEELILDRDTYAEKIDMGNKMAQIVYEGKWFTPLREAVQAFVEKTQEYVTGEVKFKLYKGNIIKAGTTSPYSLYNESLASFTTGDLYDHHDAEGFINLFGLSSKVRAMKMQEVEKNNN